MGQPDIRSVEIAPRLYRTGLEAPLAPALDAEPDPTAIIFHLSRCGSTLVARMPSVVPDMHALSEPDPLNQPLLAPLRSATRIAAVRAIVKCLGRSPCPQDVDLAWA